MAVPSTTEAWLPALDGSAAKYQAIADAMTRGIESGALAAGVRLPPQRELAARLGVDLTTVTRAYDMVRRAGLIEARGRAGSFVREAPALPAAELRRLETGMNMPPELPGNLLPQAIGEATAALMAGGGTAYLQYEPAGGGLRDREMAAALVGRMGLAADEAQMVVTAGGQHALHAVLAATVRPGEVVACGRHVYPGFKALAAALGFEALPLEPFGAESLRAACRRGPVAAVYVVPTNDNPTARTLDLAERAALAEVARAHGVRIIEDDAYGLLAPAPLTPVTGFAPEAGWYIASTSKIICPALRVAAVRAPGAAAALALRARVYETAVMAPPLNAAIVGHWLGNGMFDRLLAAMRGEAERRQAIAREALAELPFAAQPGGYHLWLPLPGPARARDLAETLRHHGLSAHAAGHFAVGPAADDALRISLGGLIDHRALAQCLTMAHAHATQERPAGATVV